MPDISLSSRVVELAREALSASKFRVNEILNPDQFDLVSNSLAMDHLAKKDSTANVKSVFAGLEFDPLCLRAQAFYLANGEKPVAVMNFVIAPQGWIEQQRFIKRVPGGIQVCRADELLGLENMPNYMIIPAWTRVADEYRTSFAISGYKFLRKVIAELESLAPKNTWIRAIAMGKHYLTNFDFLDGLRPGETLPQECLPFPLEDVGVPAPDSAPTMALAKPRHLNLHRFLNIGHDKTLGPVFARRVS